MLAAMRVQATRRVGRGVRPRATRRRPEAATQESNNNFAGCSVMVCCSLREDAIAGSGMQAKGGEDGASELNAISYSTFGFFPGQHERAFVLLTETRPAPSFCPLSHQLPVNRLSNFPRAGPRVRERHLLCAALSSKLEVLAKPGTIGTPEGSKRTV